MVQISRDSILQLLEQRGPLVPNDVKKVLGGDTIIIGATLAELSSRKLVKLTSIKKGGSPYYYLPGQENQLESIIDHLPPREKELVEFLKKERVVQDNRLEVYQRATLRQLKDFAKEFKATTIEGEILFWRYFTIPLDEAINILNVRFSKKEAVADETPKEQQTLDALTEQKTVGTEQPIEKDSLNSSSEEETRKDGVEENEVIDEKPSRIIDTVQEVQAEIDSVVGESESTNEQSEDYVEITPNKEPVVDDVFAEETSSPKESITEELNKEQTIESNKENYNNLAEENQEKIILEPALEETPFYKQILSYFDSKGIKMLSEEQLSKDKEYEFLIQISSVVGEMTLLCRAKNKKRLTESDVAPALLRAKNKNLFCLFLTPGEFTKKSKELISKEYTGLMIKQL